MKKKKKISNEPLDDPFDKIYDDILKIEEERENSSDPLKKLKYPIEEKSKEVINYDFEKE